MQTEHQQDTCCKKYEEKLERVIGKYEERVKDLEQEIYLMKEQMMAQRTMLKDAIDHGHHLQEQINQYQESEL